MRSTIKNAINWKLDAWKGLRTDFGWKFFHFFVLVVEQIAHKKFKLSIIMTSNEKNVLFFFCLFFIEENCVYLLISETLRLLGNRRRNERDICHPCNRHQKKVDCLFFPWLRLFFDGRFLSIERQFQAVRDTSFLPMSSWTVGFVFWKKIIRENNIIRNNALNNQRYHSLKNLSSEIYSYQKSSSSKFEVSGRLLFRYHRSREKKDTRDWIWKFFFSSLEEECAKIRLIWCDKMAHVSLISPLQSTSIECKCWFRVLSFERLLSISWNRDSERARNDIGK